MEVLSAILNMPALLSTLLAGLAIYLLQRVAGKAKRRASLPPGPTGLPLVGNLFDIPTSNQWIKFAEWGKKYGDICSVTILGKPMIILNSAKAATDLLDKKSAIYSDRPIFPMAGELAGWSDMLILTPYGEKSRLHRKLLHKEIGTVNSVQRHVPVAEAETRLFINRVISKPEDLATHIRHTAAAIILHVSHGYEVQEHHDPFIDLADNAVSQFSDCTTPGAFWVDVAPILRYVPEWCPGAGFKKLAKEFRQTLRDMPHNFVKEQMNDGTAIPSYTRELLEKKGPNADEELAIKWSAASLYSGGADTTVSAIHAFFLAMTLYPEVQKQAQAEIDTVVGTHTLPTYTDRERLPYVDALVKEVLRWNTVVPLAPHRVMEEDVYEGYRIPAGSTMLANLDNMLHDPLTYPDPSVFDPTRFIPSEGKVVQKDPRSICFGFGRRICPGLHFADMTVFSSCAMALATLNIAKCIKNGMVVEPVTDKTPGSVNHPVPFKCSITARAS
ncbi:hypothetical protein PLICRDRAFT_93731 [Plicaturopsis crispa FD-325 SS-3]|nr:hypothetical protein PLICRDRAFT_93731 [Plicaturopsis crispa FD-325 SS-3]